MFCKKIQCTVLLLVLTVHLQCQKLAEHRDRGGPILDIGDDYVFTIDEERGLPLVVTCSGTKELSWSTTVPPGYYKNTTGVSTEKYPFQSIFTVEEPIQDDTGLLKCSYSDGATAWSYIYVYHPDGSIFVDPPGKAPRNIYVSANNRVQLPCKVTHPNVTVNVYKDSQKLDESTYTLFPKEGVVIKKSTMSKFGGYKCENPHNTSDVNLFVASAEEKVQINMPNITTYGNANHIIGGSLDLNCSIPLRSGLNLGWGNLPSNVRATEPIITTMGYSRLLTTLHIEKATIYNSRVYTCTARLADVQSQDMIEIIFKDYVDPYVKFISQNETLVVPRGYFSWKLWFRGYPENIAYKFINPAGHVINQTTEVAIDYSYINGRISLNMNHLTPNDFGKYQARLSTADNAITATAYAYVIVSHLPVIRIPAIPLAHSGVPINLTANILSYDGNEENTGTAPNVTWWISDNCTKGLHSCTQQKTSLNSTLLRDEGPENRWISVVEQSFLRSGVVWCEVTDKRGSHKNRTDLVVTDTSYALSFIITTESGETKLPQNPVNPVEVIEGDDITFSCNAVRYLYSSLKLQSDGSDVVRSNCETNLTLGQCLSVHNIISNYTASFNCSIYGHRGIETVTYNVDLVTKENMAPRMINGSDLTEDGREITATIGKEFSISCEAEAVPPAKLLWFKDGNILENNTDAFVIMNSGSTLHFPFAVPENTGDYACFLENRIGAIALTAFVEIQGRGWETWHYILTAAAIASFIFLSSVIFHLRSRVRKERQLKMELRKNTMYLFEHGNTVDLNPEFTTDEQAELLPYDHSYEIPREQIRLGKILGSGAFGVVKLARLDDIEEKGKKTLGAVKMCKDSTDSSQLRSLTVELKIMIHIGRHLNIVNLLGAHTSNVSQGELWIIVEYCKYGNLLKFIRKYKSQFIDQINPDTDNIEVDDIPGYHNPLSPTASIARKSSRCTSLSRSRKTTTASLCKDGAYRPSVGSRNYVGNPEYERMNATNIPPERSQNPQRTSTVSGTADPTFTGPNSRKNSVASTTYTCDETGTYYKNGIPMSPLSQGSGGYSSFYGGTLKKDSSVPGISAPFNTSSLLCWAWQMACGMEYLASRKVLHSDLAARNLLLASNNILKISDFGLSREMYKKDVYCKKSDDLMPIKWMSLEAIQERLFSTQSDVWAYGVTLWEIFTLGNSPYPGVPVDNEFVVQLENGMRMSQPKHSNKLIYDIMLKCWDLEPTERPSFTELADIFSEMMSTETKEEYLSMNEIHQQRNQKYFEKNTDYLTMVGSPDIVNIQNCEISESRVDDFGSDENVIESPATQQLGYLPMGSVCQDSVTPEIFSPRPPEDNIFQFPIAINEENENNSNESGLKMNNEFFDKIRLDSQEDKEILENRGTEDPSIPDYCNLGTLDKTNSDVQHDEPKTGKDDPLPVTLDNENLANIEPEYLNAVKLAS